MIQDFLRFRQPRTPSANFRWADDSPNWVTDTLGREIDGTDNGQPGGDFIATVTGSRVTSGGIPLARVRRQPTTAVDVVDRLLARGDLAEVKRSVHAQREKSVELDQKVLRYLRGT
jgi:hypothetical protein